MCLCVHLYPAIARHGHVGDVESDALFLFSQPCAFIMFAWQATPCHVLAVCGGLKHTEHCASCQGLVTAEVQKKSGEVGCVLCVGHNKGMEEAASSLAVRLSSCNYISFCTARIFTHSYHDGSHCTVLNFVRCLPMKKSQFLMSFSRV